MFLKYPMRSCKHCGAIFEAINPKQMYCSLPCRFWSKVKVGSTDTCWAWQAYTNVDNYGIIRINRKSERAHCICWELTYGPIPKGLNVLHHCDNPSCVNPHHLFLGTQSDNMHDMAKKSRSAIQKGEMNGNVKLSIKDVLTIKELIEFNVLDVSIAKLFNVTPQAIYRIKTKKAWAFVY